MAAATRGPSAEPGWLAPEFPPPPTERREKQGPWCPGRARVLPAMVPSSQISAHTAPCPAGCPARRGSLEAITLATMMVVVAWIPAATIHIMLPVCKPGTVPNAACTTIIHGPSPACAVLFAHFTDGAPTAQRPGGLPETHDRQVSESACASVNLSQGGCEIGPCCRVVGAGQRPQQGAGRTLPPARRGPLLALSPRGQALQGKQKSVVNTVPNPKWLLPNCNPIKVRLVYLSSLGLFITVQMAATFGRLSSSLPAASRPPREA